MANDTRLSRARGCENGDRTQACNQKIKNYFSEIRTNPFETKKKKIKKNLEAFDKPHRLFEFSHELSI